MVRKAYLPNEKGQTIVILAAGIIVLLGFIGLAVDLGVLWVRDSQLSTAVDAAALAGAPELSGADGINGADLKASQFLHSNGIPEDSITAFTSDQGRTEIGAVEYSITVTWAVDTYFMRVFNFQSVDVTRSATAAYFPLVDLYSSRRTEDGALSTSNQSIFGPAQHIRFGDPYSPLDSPFEPGVYSYQYRIMVPSDYETKAGTSIVRVELFDPDSINRSNNNTQIFHTQRYVNATGRPQVKNASCGGTQQNACLIKTCELAGQCGGADASPIDDIELINPFWFVRIDENRRRGNTPGSYTPSLNTATLYELFYFQESADGSLRSTPLARYTGQTGDGQIDYDDFNHNTDIRWVSPGAFNDFGEVPTDCGSETGGFKIDARNDCPDGTVLPGISPEIRGDYGLGGGFEVDLNLHTPNIVVDKTNGNRFIYLNVTALSGASENGYEIWAGPPESSRGYPSDGNSRNVAVADNAGSNSSRTSAGVTVFAMGVLPMNSNTSERVTIPLMYIPGTYAGRTVFVSLFDFDAGSRPPLRFFFDTIHYDPDNPENSDYQVTFDASDTEGRCFANGGNCGTQWISPALDVPIPDLTPECTDPATQPAEICTPFYGGRLMIDYNAGGGDTFVWQVTIPSLPYLVR